MAKDSAGPTATRDKVGSPDPWMELDLDCVFLTEGAFQIK
jgi:hypothetical protein